ncbi:hypothetical protein L6164_010985 [Bauhinia variegata]|uniref:Uncharacterized protein n=1 Tax=Bauhinia variegata TaxID=167791 RepID=A0ACB9P4B6_BAUVA|nr:hypothetical protein L6164_010985 [Bauhinia variegata]
MRASPAPSITSPNDPIGSRPSPASTDANGINCFSPFLTQLLSLISIFNLRKDPELGFQSAPSSRSPDRDRETSDLNHLAEADALHGELHNKLDLKDKEEEPETENKDSEFDDGMQVSIQQDADESGNGDGWNEDNSNWNANDSNNWNENVNDSEHDWVASDVDVTVRDEEKKDDRSCGRPHKYPVRPEAEDCAFYLKTGTCKFGFNCKFNHPVRRKNQAVKEKAGEREESAERQGQAECKYYLTSGGCKFGKACKYNHTRGKCSVAPILELNFLGLPIRPGEKECPYYMRNGSCKFGANCRFNHPDPTAVGGSDPPSGYGNGGNISLHGASQPSVPTWSSPRTVNEAAPFVPMMLSPTQGVSPQSSEWNGYQAPVYLSERSMHPPSTYVMNNPAIEANVYIHPQKQMQAEEFPERPGEPECTYFMKTGDCKFKFNCKFHHPKNRIAGPPPCALSDKGLPLRPDKNICSHYSRYGICKFGPACKFDHPTPSTMSGLDQQSSFPNSANVEVDGLAGSPGASDVAFQQSV